MIITRNTCASGYIVPLGYRNAGEQGSKSRCAGSSPLRGGVLCPSLRLVATGTTSYVCGGKVVAFGHPFLFAGPTVIGATRARVLGIVDDPTLGPFKYATLTSRSGSSIGTGAA